MRLVKRTLLSSFILYSLLPAILWLAVPKQNDTHESKIKSAWGEGTERGYKKKHD